MLKLASGGRFSSLRVAVPTLLGLALALTVVLAWSLERWYSTVAEPLLMGGQPARISVSDLGRLALIATLLVATAGVSALVVQGYRKTQQDLARAQVLSRNILENMVGGVIAFDTEGRMIVANPAARRMLELPDAHGDGGLDLLAARQPDMAQFVRSALEEKRYVQDRDVGYTRSSKQSTCLRVATCPLLANEGKRDGLVVLVKDVTRLVQMEQRLRQLDRQAVTETMAAGVAHEVRNPLSAISLNLRLLQDEVFAEVRNPQEIQEYFEILDAETRRLNRITEEFLTVSRPTPLVRRKLLVTEVIDRVARLLQAEAAEKSVSLRVTPASQTLEVFGDAERLEQVLINVLVNALEATPAKGEIAVWAEPADIEQARLVEIGVRDNGAGIPPECLPRLFDPYFTTKTSGTGLGLAIAHRIISDHGGEIRVDSTPGIGTTVSIMLPVEAPEWQTSPVAGL
jgi:signal transduction histidine kinase